MKALCITLCCSIAICTSVSLFAQKAYETKVAFKKQQVQATEIQINHSPDIVKEAILKELAEKGYKAKKDFNYIIYQEIKWEKEEYTLHLQIDQRSRREKEAATVTIIAQNKAGEFISRNTHKSEANAMEDLAENMAKWSGKESLERNIIGQQKNIDAASTKLTELEKANQALSEKIVELQKSQEEQLKKIAAQQKAIETEKGILKTLEEKRKSN